MAKVYAKLKDCKGMQLITDINSEYYIADLTGWTLIDEGKGSKYTHAQTDYLGDTLSTEDGYYKYKFVSDTGVVKLTDEEMALQKGGTQPDTPVDPPDEPGTDTNYDFPQYYIADGLEQRIIIDEIKEDKLVTGFNFSFIAIFDNEGKATTINDYPFYKEGTTEPPVVKEQHAYTVWFDEDKKCFFVEASATGDAVPADVLEGVTFSSDTGADQEGTMKNNGAVKKVLDYDEEFEIAEGYHNGQGKVVAPSAGEDSTETTALASDLLAGKTARSKGKEITGEMTDNGAVKKVLDYDEEFVIPKGYHNGEGKVVAPSIGGEDTSDATLTNSNQLEYGVTAYSKGKKVVGNVPRITSGNQITLACGQSYKIPAGIHDGKQVIFSKDLASQTGGNATSVDIVSGKTAIVNGQLVKGSMPNVENGVHELLPNEEYRVGKGYSDGNCVVKAKDIKAYMESGSGELKSERDADSKYYFIDIESELGFTPRMVWGRMYSGTKERHFMAIGYQLTGGLTGDKNFAFYYYNSDEESCYCRSISAGTYTLTNGRVLVAESNSSRSSERNLFEGWAVEYYYFK